MGLLYGQDWKRLRKIFDPAFTHSAAVARIDVVDGAARKYVQGLPHLAGQNTAGEKAFSLPVLRTFSKFPYFLTASAIYGPMTETEEHDLWSITEKRVALNQYWIGGGPYRIETLARLYDAGAVRSLREFNTEWHDYNARIVQVRRARNEMPPIITYWEEYERGNMAMVEVSLLVSSMGSVLIDFSCYIL
jgi:cytochrome P450